MVYVASQCAVRNTVRRRRHETVADAMENASDARVPELQVVVRDAIQPSDVHKIRVCIHVRDNKLAQGDCRDAGRFERVVPVEGGGGRQSVEDVASAGTGKQLQVQH